MKRRTLISGVLLAGGAAVGHFATKRFCGGDPATSPANFLSAMTGVRLQYVSHDLLLKLYARAVSRSDRQQVVFEAVDHNRNLFVADAYDRHHGYPGFYRVTE